MEYRDGGNEESVFEFAVFSQYNNNIELHKPKFKYDNKIISV